MMKRLSLLLCLMPMVSAYSTEFSVAIQPFGNVDTLQLISVIPFLAKEYKIEKVEILNSIELPKSAYYKPRNRYRAELLLAYLDSIANDRYYRVIGFTDKDISTTKGEFEDWGIFGLGDIGGYACVVSTHRLKKGNGKEVVQERLKRILIHELGHTFGLYHCDWPKCVMANYKGTIQILDEQWSHLCASCKRRFRAKYK